MGAIEKINTDNQRSALVSVVEKHEGLALSEMNSAEKAFALADATRELRDSLTTEIVAQLMEIMDKPYGFRTDRAPGTTEYREKGPYTESDVRDVMICAVLHGLRPVGNEINIIARNMYATKEAFARKLREFNGLSDLRISFGVPSLRDGGALVECRASWNINGARGSIGETDDDKCVIPVRVNKAMGTDAILGKCERKLMKRIYDRVTGSRQTIPDGEIETELTIEREATVIDSALTKTESLKNRAKKHVEKTPPDTIEREPGSDDDNAPSPDVSGIADACADYRKLCSARDRTPTIVDRAISAARNKHPECASVREFCDIDHTNEIQCELVFGEFLRLRDVAIGRK
jgi:hypothetical protein